MNDSKFNITYLNGNWFIEYDGKQVNGITDVIIESSANKLDQRPIVKFCLSHEVVNLDIQS